MGTEPEPAPDASSGPAPKAEPPKADAIELAVQVSERIEILSITLVECQVTRDRTVNLNKQDLRVVVEIVDVLIATDRAHNLLVVTPTFELVGTKRIAHVQQPVPGADDKDVLTIRASFELAYLADGLQDFSDESLHAFAQTNGVFNAWPYWREFVQSTTARMGTKPIVVPVFRI